MTIEHRQIRTVAPASAIPAAGVGAAARPMRGQLSFNDSGEPRRRGNPHRGSSEGESEGSVAGRMGGKDSGSRHRSPRDVSPLLTAGDVASLLGVPRTWVYEQSRASRIPTVTLGRYRRYRLEAIEAWLRRLEASGS
jgi:excisionase family DNA binding protein